MNNGQPRCVACRQEQIIFPFSMAFQPVVDLEQHRIDAHEALVRGPAGEPASAVLGQVTEQSLYAFDQACRVKAIEMAADLGLTTQLNINFLPNAVYEPKSCIRQTLEVAARTGFPLDRLTFEFSEQQQITDNRHILSIIAAYRDHGFKIALDDFGSSYSGLTRMADLKPDIIKIDQALMRDIDTDPMRQTIVTNLARMASEIGIKVVAEGMERREEVEAARVAGIRFMQGYYFARPQFESVARESDITWLEPGDG